MSDDRRSGERSLAVLETVRCLECGAVYSKPTSGGTAQANPGCPECGYVGWLSTRIPITEEDAQPRFDADHPLHRSE